MAELSIEEALEAELASLRPSKLANSKPPSSASTAGEPAAKNAKKAKRLKPKRKHKRDNALDDAPAGVSVAGRKPTSKRALYSQDVASRAKKSLRTPPLSTLDGVPSHKATEQPAQRSSVQVVNFIDPDAQFSLAKAAITADPTEPSPDDDAAALPNRNAWVDPRQLLKEAAKDITDMNIASSHG